MENIILVHGLWMVGVDMFQLRKRLSQRGFNVHQFSYPSVRKSPSESAERLQQFVISHCIEGEKVHIVAHSLGGLVVRHLMAIYPDLMNGNVVTLGTPHQGSIVAQKLKESRLGRLLLGKSTQQGLLGDAPRWSVKNKLGIIAGKGGMGIGKFIVSYTEENDGSVMLSETKLKGMTDYLIAECGHIGLLYNKDVASQVCYFLKEGCFQHDT